jgi:hypothetical protein
MPIRHSDDTTLVFKEPVHSGAHHQPEMGISAGFVGEKLEKLRLRHHRHIRKLRWESPIHGHFTTAARGHDSERWRFCVRQRKHAIGQANLMENFHRRRMNGVAPEVSVEVLMHLDDSRRNTRTNQ